MDIDLSAEIEKLLEEEYDRVSEILEESSEKVAEEAVKELKSNSPKKSGKYRLSWANKKSKNWGIGVNNTIHNKKHYRLTHLLEFGHAKVNGGRVEARPHIEAVEQRAMKKFEDAIRRGIENG